MVQAEILTETLSLTDEEKPLPKGWRFERLGDVCQFIYGSSLSTTHRIKGDVPVYGSNGLVGYHNQAITSGQTIIIGRKGSVGEVHFSSVACFPIDTTYFIDETATKVDLRFLFYILKSVKLKELNKSTAVPGLNRDDACAITVSLPPTIEEQRRIASILDGQMKAVEQARLAVEEQLAAANLLPNAFLRSVFESEEAQNWQKTTFENIAILQRGYDLPSQDQVKGKYPIITSSGIMGTHHEFREHAPGVVTGRSGSIGKVYYTEQNYFPHNTALFIKDFKGNYPRYIYHLIRKIDLRTVASGSGVPTLDRKEVHKLVVRHPDLETQIKISENLDEQMQAVETLKKPLTDKLEAVKKLPAALLRRAFAGEI